MSRHTKKRARGARKEQLASLAKVPVVVVQPRPDRNKGARIPSAWRTSIMHVGACKVGSRLRRMSLRNGPRRSVDVGNMDALELLHLLDSK